MTERKRPPEEGQEPLFSAAAWEVRGPTEVPVDDAAAGELEALERATGARPADAGAAGPVPVPPTDSALAGPAVERPADAPLSGPTLDDVMSRAWESLSMGLPAACPLCHGEVVPLAGEPLAGRCTSCGTEIE